MNSIKEVLNDTLNRDLKQIIISKARAKNQYIKIKIRPTIQGKRLVFHVEKFTQTQAFHENLNRDKCIGTIEDYALDFQQIQIFTDTFNYSILISKKGKVTVNKKRITEKTKPDEYEDKPDLSHNRKKNHILEEGFAIPFLVDLGIMTKDGKIVNSKQDKIRQINRFLEFIQDIVPELEEELVKKIELEEGEEPEKDKLLERVEKPEKDKELEIDGKREKGKELTIVDFGCGKSYLTFAIYYYLHVLKGLNVRIVGLDLKEDVIEKCNKLAKKYKYEKLKFIQGDAREVSPSTLGIDSEIQMVISLHACDTATDIAIGKAVSWNAKVIFAVPCCQKEVNQQIRNQALQPILKYGLLKERFSSLATDAIRGGYLEALGYKTQILEFIDMEHTPKNVLIRSIREGRINQAKMNEMKRFEEYLNIQPSISEILRGELGDEELADREIGNRELTNRESADRELVDIESSSRAESLEGEGGAKP